MNTFTALDSYLGTRAMRLVDKLRNTTVRRLYNDGGVRRIALSYMGDDLVIAREDHTYDLRSGRSGRPLTELKRLNRFSPARVFSQAGHWRVARTDGPTDIAFQDGMRVDGTGQPCTR